VESIAIILLAAGGSSRLGTPKQMLPVGGGETLLTRAARTALAARVDRVIVVLGAHADACQQALTRLPVEIVLNATWADGQASSLRAGLAHLAAGGTQAQAAVIMLCDQPRVSPELLDALIARYHDRRAVVVASRYATDVVGPPALFDRSLFAELETLTGDIGARRVIEAHATDLETVPFPGGTLDIDTPADANALT
jgi:molybdenum cofactor cytidylyltransferase